MHSLASRRVRVAPLSAPNRALLGRARRGLTLLSPPVAAALLTAAAFLLPATSGEATRINDIKLSATHIYHDDVGMEPTARR